jgi:hypothetical protein
VSTVRCDEYSVDAFPRLAGRKMDRLSRAVGRVSRLTAGKSCDDRSTLKSQPDADFDSWWKLCWAPDSKTLY